MRGLYLHIPFCKTRCHYCDFVTRAGASPDLRKRFFACLFHEIEEVRSRYGRLAFETLYFGGGTPSVLLAEEWDELFKKIRGSFEIKADAEITCEFNPGDAEDAQLESLRRFGVDRISLGCQAFQDGTLKRLGRRHTVREIAEAVAKIQKAGISNISFDLMLRLPGQTVEDFRDSLRRCVEIGASQVSLYDLEVHDGTPFGQRQKKGKLDLPEETEHARMYESAVELLTEAGYEHYEISNFAKPGLASRHNLIYWRNQEYLGLGPGAFTYLNGVRSQFAPELERYLAKCEAQDWKRDVEDVLSDEEKETETLVTGLRLREGVVLAAFPKVETLLSGRVETLCGEGLMERSGKNVRLTARGKFISESVFGFLLEKDPVKQVLPPRL